VAVELDGPLDVAVAFTSEDVMEPGVGMGGIVYRLDAPSDAVELTPAGPVAVEVGVDGPVLQKEDTAGAVPGNDKVPVVLLAYGAVDEGADEGNPEEGTPVESDTPVDSGTLKVDEPLSQLDWVPPVLVSVEELKLIHTYQQLIHPFSLRGSKAYLTVVATGVVRKILVESVVGLAVKLAAEEIALGTPVDNEMPVDNGVPVDSGIPGPVEDAPGAEELEIGYGV
jgi:hypothetical protein